LKFEFEEPIDINRDRWDIFTDSCDLTIVVFEKDLIECEEKLIYNSKIIAPFTIEMESIDELLKFERKKEIKEKSNQNIDDFRFVI